MVWLPYSANYAGSSMQMNDELLVEATVDVHELTPEGLSSYPIMQFMAEVEELLVAHELI